MQVGPESVGASEGFLGWIAYLGAANAGIPLSIIVKNYGWEVRRLLVSPAQDQCRSLSRSAHVVLQQGCLVNSVVCQGPDCLCASQMYRSQAMQSMHICFARFTASLSSC